MKLQFKNNNLRTFAVRGYGSMAHCRISVKWHLEGRWWKGKMDIDENTVAKLLHQQFPHLSQLPIEPVRKQGWDNVTFRLGDALSVRLPSNASYAAAVRKEAEALAVLGDHLSAEVPRVVAVGEPCEAFPLPWSIRQWIVGDTLETAEDINQETFAVSLGRTLCELRAIEAGNGPIAGKHSFYRGCHPSVYGDEVQQSLDILDGKVDKARCLDIWQEGMTSAWTDRPVWFHGDVAVGNIIAADNSVKALIDFGCCGIGDPACDFVMAWTYFLGREPKGLPRSLRNRQSYLAEGKSLGALESSGLPVWSFEPRHRWDASQSFACNLQ